MRQSKHCVTITTIRVWDLPTRVFHWLLAAGFLAAWLTHGQDRYLDIHVFSGYLFLALLLFRIIWGFVGSHYALFRNFSYGHRAFASYIRQALPATGKRYIGHNPAGSWAIFMMLMLGGAVGMTGLLLFGVEERHGPMAGILPFSFANRLQVSHEILAWSMLVLVLLHIASVVIKELWNGENLISAMFTGHKQAEAGNISVSARSVVGVLLLISATGSAYGYFRGYLAGTVDQPYLPYLGPSLAENALWREECGGCHLAYHPSLLPARSWQRLIEMQADHFGEDLALDVTTLSKMNTFLMENSADQEVTEAAWKIGQSIAANEVPLRITATPYWKRKHQDFAAQYWNSPGIGGKADCEACHLDAAAGTFEDAAMQIPQSSVLEKGKS